ncbi:S-adenosylmethionine decarboxylase related protein [Bacillus cereus]|uniref:S-adenosylmethionine decarboxylase related protein n=1 Tax=Bacillus cereus TaxID=1396 RepID=A0A2A7HTF5_BACCE|nr:S-adenosylmethionine decarboxylase related protein [Bacillus cereus]PEC20261.1 S-adenosylmethionine decarboxylase related protein [Bacillus cereus]
MTQSQLTLSLLGSGGGVAKAILALLNQTAQDEKDPIHSYIKNCTIHLIDMDQKPLSYYSSFCNALQSKLVLHEFDLGESSLFRTHLQQAKPNIVIDVSWADTVKMLTDCNEFGTHYINTAIECPEVDDNEAIARFGLLERYRIFAQHKDRFQNMTSIIGSGMNPGVVQWMMLHLMQQFPEEQPLASYIVEHDTTFYKNAKLAQENTIYTTWSPECFLDEAILNYPLFMKQHIPVVLHQDVYQQEFKVTLGDIQFYGCLMPHEEAVSLGEWFDGEVGFLYRVNEHTTNAIRSNLKTVDDLWDWEHKVLLPDDAELTGSDLIGILLVYSNKERFIYNVINSDAMYTRFHTNATYFQVACGIYGALSSLTLDSLPLGCYVVDDLLRKTSSHYGQYVSYYMKDFIIGENDKTDGLLLDRMKKIDT